MFFGQNVNVARYDQQKYEIFEKLIEKQLSFSGDRKKWMCHKTALTMPNCLNMKSTFYQQFKIPNLVGFHSRA